MDFRPLGWQRKIALSKIGEPKVGPSSWRPQRGVIHTKPNVGLVVNSASEIRMRPQHEVNGIDFVSD